MDNQFVSNVLSNQGLAVLIILFIGFVAWRTIPKIITYYKERQEIKDKNDKDREERYTTLVEKVQTESKERENDSKEREIQLNKVVESTNAINQKLSEGYKILSESNKLLVEGYGIKMDKMEVEIGEINDKFDLVICDKEKIK